MGAPDTSMIRIVSNQLAQTMVEATVGGPQESDIEGCATMLEPRPGDRDLAPSMMHLSLADEISALKRESAWLNGDRNAKTLYKDPADLRVVLMVLKAGATLSRHSAPGPVTIHLLDGHGHLEIDGQELDLQSGSLVALERKRQHSLQAVDDCAVLISIAWPSDDSRT